jgi:hypothetical protein
MKLNKQLWQVVATVIGLLAAATAAEAGNKVVEPGREFSGKSYNELAGEWTNWLVTEPIATNPAFDPDGRFCGLNQQGKVWFLASTFDGIADRTCEIPAGKALFLSLGGVFVSFAPEFPASDDPCSQLTTDAEKVRCDVNNDVPVAPTTTLEAALDGEPIEDLFAFRTQSPPGGYTLRVPDPSFLTDLGLPAGDRTPAVADGYFLFLKPLSHGRHTLSFHKTNPDQSVAGVNYTLIVRGGDDD